MRFCCFVLLTCLLRAGSQLEGTGPSLREEVAAQLTRAIELEQQGQVREAERILLKLVHRLDSIAAGSLELSTALNNLAVLYSSSRRYSDAEWYFKRSVQVLQTLDADVAEEHLAKAKLHLAALYAEAGHLDNAAKLNLPILLEKLRNPEDQFRVKGTIAAIAILRKDFTTAERHYLEALSFWSEPSRASAHELEIATTLNNLGVIALRQGRPTAARERFEQSRAVLQRIAGPLSPVLIKAMSNMAAAHLHMKQYEDAATWLARTTTAARATLGEHHPFTVAIHFTHAEVLKKAGRKAEAAEIKRVAIEARAMASPSASSYTVDYRDIMRTLKNGR